MVFGINIVLSVLVMGGFLVDYLLLKSEKYKTESYRRKISEKNLGKIVSDGFRKNKVR